MSGARRRSHARDCARWLVRSLTAIATSLALGFGLLFAALNVKYRDVTLMLPVLIQLWMFVSPVLYPSGLVPAKWKTLYFLNPVAGVVEGFRSSLIGTEILWLPILIATLFALLLLVVAANIFTYREKSLADLI